MASLLDFNESNTELEYLPGMDEYDIYSDSDLSICDEEDEEMEQKCHYTYVTLVEKVFVPGNISSNFTKI
ncbi:hypothetical protein TNCV_3812731 [Trichonephila clavipes]|nr:hypothetical protein TNCV_3812731 [Trichonephila clavipes]